MTPRMQTVSLGVHFGDRSALENVDVSFAAGQTTSEAIDSVFGPGAFAAIAGSIWETLREAEAA